jgi:hypothetical protein
MNELVKDVADFFPYAEVRPFQDHFIKTIFSAVARAVKKHHRQPPEIL